LTAHTPTLDTAECTAFLTFWMEVTNVPCVTLVAIKPDSKTTIAATFEPGADLDRAADWIANFQKIEQNIYFQPNETQPHTRKKPSKDEMAAAVCRFADIDPVDGAPLADERARLGKLADHLKAMPDLPPTAIIDSGNGLQPLWAVQRLPLGNDSNLVLVERQTVVLEKALGAGGTHNIDRLLRLPGTVNYPNATKRAKGRGVSRARLIFSSGNHYAVAEIVNLAVRLKDYVADTGLVRERVKKESASRAADDDGNVLALCELLMAAGADKVSDVAHLPAPLQELLQAALKARPRLGDRWAGLVDDLAERGKDASRSGVDLSLAAMLKAADFSHVETGLMLCAFKHGKANGDDWPDEEHRLRHVARTVLRSHEPAGKSGHADSDWPEPLDFLADGDLTGTPELKPEHIPAAIAPFVFDTAARMGVDPAAVALAALVSLASVATDDWKIQPKAHDYTWTENPRIWGAIVGDPSMLKTPILRAATAPIDKLEAEARRRHDDAMRSYKTAHKAWKNAKDTTAEEPRKPLLDRYLIESTTTEAISEVLRDDLDASMRAPAKKVLVRQDEMSEWVASFDRYRSGGKGGADRGAYLRLFNGGRWTVDRIMRGNFAIQNWSACVLGGIQPGPIRQIAKDAADDGLLQRFLYVVPAHQGRGEDRRPDADAIARYDALFPALAALTPSGHYGNGNLTHVVNVALHTDSHAVRGELLDLVEAMMLLPDTSERMKSALGKWSGIWARLALLFHLIEIADARSRGEQHGVVTIVTKRVAALVTEFMRNILLPHLLRAEAIMFATEQTGHARWIAGHILARNLGTVTTRDIIRAYRLLRAPENRRELLEVMSSLEAVGWVREKSDRDGRPPTSWLVNPAVHAKFAEHAAQEKASRTAAQAGVRETLEKRRKAA
jgi:hypothetical protein